MVVLDDWFPAVTTFQLPPKITFTAEPLTGIPGSVIGLTVAVDNDGSQVEHSVSISQRSA